MITLPVHEMSEHVYIPRGLSFEHLGRVVSRVLGDEVAVIGCRATNLCAGGDERVSDSGATVLLLRLDLGDGRRFQMAAKVLSPDSTNIFKIDTRFASRRWEVALMRWWGQQCIPEVPVVYDTRADGLSREYWILHEYLPEIGYVPDDGRSEDVIRLAGHLAKLHAHTGERLDELRALATEADPDDLLAPGDQVAPGDLVAWRDLVEAIREGSSDAHLIDAIGLSVAERETLRRCRDAVERRPRWVDRWDIVCVNRDFAPHNVGVRDDGQFVTFDWGAAHLGPAEEDFDVLLRRDFAGQDEARDLLVEVYLLAYSSLTGRDIDEGVFLARIPWARLMVTLRYIAGAFRSLRWMPWQSRSPFLVHKMIQGLTHTLGELAGRPWEAT